MSGEPQSQSGQSQSAGSQSARSHSAVSPSALSRSERLASTKWPGPFREVQRRALDGLGGTSAGSVGRSWVVMPPGSGKTLVGLEAARRLGNRTVVFVPNTAIQTQWVATWGRYAPSAATVGISRDLADDICVLTYQSLAVFDDEALANGGRSLADLHENGRALVAALREAGPLTVVLDECHHLLELWGRLVAELLDLLPAATVIGLTATPPDSLTVEQARLVERLFGQPTISSSIPAAVRDGYLAPFAELAWLTAPTALESAFLQAEAERFAEFRAHLLTPGFASTDFLVWTDTRFVERRTADGLQTPWPQVERDAPDLARAALRLHHAGLLALPTGAPVREEHRQPPSAADWAALLDDYIGGCLRPSSDPRDVEALAAVRAALPGIGYQLTRRGLRTGRSPIDQMLARSEAKSRAAVEIIACESDALGDRLSALVVCEFEGATARRPRRTSGVQDPAAGSARLVLELLASDPRTVRLDPVLVTGRTVAAPAATAHSFVAWARERMPDLRLDDPPPGTSPPNPSGSEGTPGRVGPPDGTGVCEITGAWSPRVWVPLVTEYLETGRSRVLIGTRALLGEGWDARSVNTLVDLTTATTVTSVVQTRGRALRIDPAWPAKVANAWTVACATDSHPRGATDWTRAVRKHAGYLAANPTGEIISGVGHLDPSFTPYAPPPDSEFDAINVAMAGRATDRDRTREAWRVGQPYQDELTHLIRVRPTRTAATGLGPPPSDDAPAVPRAVPAPDGIALRPDIPDPRNPAWFVVLRRWWTAGRVAALFDEATDLPLLTAVAAAVADALHGCGQSPLGSAAVRARIGPDGVYQFVLAGVPSPAGERFAVALDEIISPIATPRWLLPRYVLPPLQPSDRRAAARTWLQRKPLPVAVVHHAVPAVLAQSKPRLRALSAAWNQRVSAGEPVLAGSPEGEGAVISQQGLSPVGATTALRLAWQ